MTVNLRSGEDANLGRAFEIAVIGAGPGGAITAALLAEAGRDVVLFEEGEYLPLESCAPFSLVEMRQKYRNGGLTPALGRTKVAYVEGRCVGGGSEINSGLYHRTPPEILESWQKNFAVEGLDRADLTPHFEILEKELSVSLLPGPAPLASLKLQEGADRLGWKALEVPRWYDYRLPSESGSSLVGRRQSMTRTFIPRFLAAGGLLKSQARIDRLRRNGSKWCLRGWQGARPMEIEAGTVFVCGGAIQTPALLRRSGIKRQIGDSLQIHPTAKIVAQFAEEVNGAGMGVPVHQVKEFAPGLSFGCSISTPPYLALALGPHPAYLRDVPTTWPNMAVYYAMITTPSVGSVRPFPFRRDPLVRYSLGGDDLRRLSDGLNKLSQLLFTAGATALYPTVPGLAPLRGPEELSRFPARLPGGTSLMTIHLFSSCPMGENRRRCATNSFGRVFDLPDLYISDASLLCTAPGVNPQGSIMALARRNALKFLGRI